MYRVVETRRLAESTEQASLSVSFGFCTFREILDKVTE